MTPDVASIFHLMPQFGAGTVIPSDVRLILIDCFDTLVEFRDWQWRPRRGVVALLSHFHVNGVPRAVISDAAADTVASALAQSGLAMYIDRVYDGDLAADPLSDGQRRKRLDLPLADFAVAPAQVVFIGDSQADAEAASHFKVPFVRVPRGEDSTFDFSVLLHGPSRYDSGDFSAKMLDHWRKPMN